MSPSDARLSVWSSTWIALDASRMATVMAGRNSSTSSSSSPMIIVEPSSSSPPSTAPPKPAPPPPKPGFLRWSMKPSASTLPPPPPPPTLGFLRWSMKPSASAPCAGPSGTEGPPPAPPKLPSYPLAIAGPLPEPDAAAAAAAATAAASSAAARASGLAGACELAAWPSSLSRVIWFLKMRYVSANTSRSPVWPMTKLLLKAPKFISNLSGSARSSVNSPILSAVNLYCVLADHPRPSLTLSF
mmetsp:Transcript_16553/g.50866  ORF Transcript_16553/g.50866 Transcript_16553/m.50866 type:complete len:243 (-) Transcript_16553:885-1613(-)